MAGLDVRNDQAMEHGWQSPAGMSLKAAVKEIESQGFSEIVLTDIGKDGTLKGPNISLTADVLQMTSLGLYASGGVSSLEDIKALLPLANQGLIGCVIGKALYDGRVNLPDAIALVSDSQKTKS